jgi:hypothetical protein
MSVLDRNKFVDAMTLACIWPRELDEYQILIVNLDHNGLFDKNQGFTHIRPPNSPYVNSAGTWIGKDIIFTLQFGHFTFLVPKSENIRVNPIETLVSWAKKIDCGVATPFDLYPDPYTSGEARFSIHDALADFLSRRPPSRETDVRTPHDSEWVHVAEFDDEKMEL